MPPLDSRPTLAFIDPGRRKAPFFTLLDWALGDRFRCVYYSRRSIPRGFLRRAKVEMYPGSLGPRLPAPLPSAQAEGLRTAIGAKALARLGETKALREASRYLGDLERFFDRYNVRAILVWGGSNLLPSLAVHLARQRGISILFAEHGYLPGTTQLDPCGVNFDSSATEAVASGRAFLPPDADLDAQLDAIIAGYRAGNPMRVLRAPPPGRLRYDARTFLFRQLKVWWKDRKIARVPRDGMRDGEPLPERYVLVPFQVRKDVQLLSHSPLVGNDMAALLGCVRDAVAKVDPGLRIVAKLHPAERAQTQAVHAALARTFPDVHFLFRAPMTELIERAEAVVTINSTVGFEAILLDRPVVALGRNFYITPGVVEVVEELAELPRHLAHALATPIDRERRRSLLRYIASEFLVYGSYDDCREESVKAIARRITQQLSPLIAGAAVERPIGARAASHWTRPVTS